MALKEKIKNALRVWKLAWKKRKEEKKKSGSSLTLALLARVSVNCSLVCSCVCESLKIHHVNSQRSGSCAAEFLGWVARSACALKKWTLTKDLYAAPGTTTFAEIELAPTCARSLSLCTNIWICIVHFDLPRHLLLSPFCLSLFSFDFEFQIWHCTVGYNSIYT